MRRTGLALLGVTSLLTLPATASAQEAFSGVITYRMTSEGRTVEAKIMTRGSKTRMEMPMQGMPGTAVMLMDTETMKMQMIMQSMGVYLEMDLARAAASAPAREPGSPAAIEKLNTSEEIAGIHCENYRFREGDEPESEACIATGMGWFLGGPAGGPGTRGGPPAGPDWAAYTRDFRDGMLPLRMKVRRGDTWVTMMEATAVDPTPVEASLFELPAGLRKMAMPGGE